MPEFLGGLACLLAGVLSVGAAVRLGPRAVKACLWAGVALDIWVISTLMMDWGYSWVDVTAISVAAQRNIWIAFPHAFALLSLMAMVVWGLEATPYVVVLTALQTAVFAPVMVFVGLDTDMSFLAPAPLSAMYGSALAAFCFLAPACSVLPRPGSRWYAIAFGSRADLIESVRSLSSMGLSTAPPTSVFESGSASGLIDGVHLDLDTRPSVMPPAYALRLTVMRNILGPPAAHPPPPGFAVRESFRVHADRVVYSGLSPVHFRVSPGSLQGLVKGLCEGLGDRSRHGGAGAGGEC